MTITRRNKKIAIELRRDRVQQLLSRGHTQRSISAELGISLGLVNHDISYIRRQARENLAHYINTALPEELSNALIRLRDLIREAWKDIEDPNTSKKDRYAALQLVKDCSESRLEIISGGILTDRLNKQSQQGQPKQQSQSQHNETSTVSQ